MTYPLTYRKTCRTAEQAAKERTILRALQTSTRRHLFPKLVEVGQDPLIVEMLYIKGEAPTQEDFREDVLDELGTTLRQLHHFRPCTTFGSFDADFVTINSHVTFANFLETQIGKWADWHGAQPGSYIYSYVAWLRHEFDKLRNYFNDVEPLFCHGDIDIKNLILQEGKLVGLIDWEHAGSYCLAWELRKLSRILQYDWQWERLFTVYGDVSIQDQCVFIVAVRYLNVVDLLGHLRWCIMRGLQSQEAETLQQMHVFLKQEEVN